MESPVSIENQVEGPHPKFEVHISKKDYVSQWGTGKDPYQMIFTEVIKQLPESELKTAFEAATKERDARTIADKGYLDPVITEEAKRYAFRGIKRRSDNQATWENDKSTLDSVDTNVHIHGIDAPGHASARNIMSGMIWDPFTFPNPNDLENHGMDTSIILVYKNEPYILPSNPGATETYLFTPRSSESREKQQKITIVQAKEGKYSTLRDLYVGQIEIHFDKEKRWQIPQIFQRKQK